MNAIWESLVNYKNWGGMSLLIVMALYILVTSVGTAIIRRNGRRVKVRRVLQYQQPFIDTLSCNTPLDKAMTPRPLPIKVGAIPGGDAVRKEIAMMFPVAAPWGNEDGTVTPAEEIAIDVELDRVRRMHGPRIVPPIHEHCIDLERSRMVPLEDGRILAQCCVAGCPTVISLGRNIAHIVIEDRARAAV